MLYRTHVDAAHIYWDQATQSLKVGVIDGSTLRSNSDVVVRLGPDADKEDREVSRIKLPDSDALSFLGRPGDIVWNAPAQFYDGWVPVWAGVGSGRIPSNVARNSLALTLDHVEGPGWVSVWRSGASFVLEDLNSSKPDKSSMSMVAGGHGHYNWAFEKPGRYRTYWRATARTEDGQEISSPVMEVTWLVGPDSAVDLPEGTTRSDPITTRAEDFDGRTGPGAEDDSKDETRGDDELPDQGAYTCAAPGHYDLSARTDEEGGVSTYLHDESGQKDVERASNSVVVPVPDSTMTSLHPDGPMAPLATLGKEGTHVWTLPEQQDPDLVWLGMNTQGVDYTRVSSDGVRVNLSNYTAPGRMVHWVQGSLSLSVPRHGPRADGPLGQRHPHRGAHPAALDPGVQRPALQAAHAPPPGHELQRPGRLRCPVHLRGALQGGVRVVRRRVLGLLPLLRRGGRGH